MPLFFLIAGIVALAYVATAWGPKPPKPKPASLEEFDFPTAQEGRELPWHFGSPDDVAANVIGTCDFRTKPIKTKGGKK